MKPSNVGRPRSVFRSFLIIGFAFHSAIAVFVVSLLQAGAGRSANGAAQLLNLMQSSLSGLLVALCTCELALFVAFVLASLIENIFADVPWWSLLVIIPASFIANYLQSYAWTHFLLRDSADRVLSGWTSNWTLLDQALVILCCWLHWTGIHARPLSVLSASIGRGRVKRRFRFEDRF